MRRSRAAQQQVAEPRKGPGALPTTRERDEERVPRRPKEVGKPEATKVPHDPVNEQVVIAAALVDPAERRRLLDLVQPESFFAKGHPEAWRAIAQLERKGLAYDPATVQQLVGDEVDTGYLDVLIETRPAVPPNLMHHVACLAWDRTRVEAVRGPVAALLELLRDPNSDPTEVRAKARAVGDTFGMGSTRLLDTANVVREQKAVLEARRTGQAIYPYGIDGLDVYDAGPKAGRPRMIRGAAPTKLTCVTGLPGSGKSTVIGRIVLGQIANGRKVLWGAWEEGEGDSIEQLAVMSLGLSREAENGGGLTREEEREVFDEMDRLAPFVRFVGLRPHERGSSKARRDTATDRALDEIHEAVVSSACDVFVADLWRRDVKAIDPEDEEVALYRQQEIAKRTNTHAILVHQQRLKDVEQREDKRPTREGLKGSCAWVECPDTILAVHRPALWKNVADDVLELLVLKQRKAPWPLCVEFDFDPDTATLTNGRGVDVKRALGAGGTDDSLDRFLGSGEEQLRGRRGSRRGGG